jgi:uncharacterized membrane protein
LQDIVDVAWARSACDCKGATLGFIPKEENAGKQTFRNRILHGAFALGIWIKGFDAALEIVGGFIFLLASNLTLNRLVIALTEHELVEDPRDKIAILLRYAVAHITSDTHLYGGAYLIIHGLTKLWLVTGLLRSKSWAYPATICFLCLFIAYQLYRVSYQYSPGLILLTLFDSVFVFLIWREYRFLKR